MEGSQQNTQGLVLATLSYIHGGCRNESSLDKGKGD